MNQTREKIGVTYGSNLTTTGGNALKFYASVRIEVRRIGAVKEGEQVVGNKTRVKVVKNKLAPPFRQAEVEILYGHGINREGEVLDLALAQGTISRSGSWFSFGETRIGQGRAAACRWLAEHAEVREQLARHCLAVVRGDSAVPPAPSPPPVRAVEAAPASDAKPGQTGARGKRASGGANGEGKGAPVAAVPATTS